MTKAIKKLSIELPEKVANALALEAERLEISTDSLVEGLIKNFLKKLNIDHETAIVSERRTSPRVQIKESAILYFKTDNGKYGLYKSGDLKDIAPGGVLVECEAGISSKDLFQTGSEFELIFQLQESATPLHMLCKICRVMQNDKKTEIGVAFTQSDEESQKILMNFFE